jgi:hypothetical protein
MCRLGEMLAEPFSTVTMEILYRLRCIIPTFKNFGLTDNCLCTEIPIPITYYLLITTWSRYKT